MGVAKYCEKCGRITFNPPGKMIKNGWTRKTVRLKGNEIQELWKCGRCSKV